MLILQYIDLKLGSVISKSLVQELVIGHVGLTYSYGDCLE